MSKLSIFSLALFLAIPAFAQDAPKTVFYTAQQMKTDLDKAPANDIGESEINLSSTRPNMRVFSCGARSRARPRPTRPRLTSGTWLMADVCW